MKKGVFVLCLAICLLFAVSSVCAGDVNDTAIASDNANQVIEEVNDEVIFESEEINEGEISSENEDILNAQDNGTFTALQTKINNAAEDSTITLENDYSYNDGFNVNGITLSKSLTIDGKGKTIDAKGQARIFNIEPDTNIILKNLILKNAYTEGDGGVIYAYKVNLTVTDSIFTDNLAQSGGAIYANESNVILSHDKFLKNQAMLAGGSIIARRTNVDISNTLFEGNYAGGGGSLQILANGRKDVTAKFENNIFKNSTATYTAGFFYTSNPTTVINCTFENYDGNEYGGLVADNNLKLISSRFKNSYNVLGGAVSLNSNENLNVINCIFENNHAQHGGAIYSNGHLTISGSHFVNNSAEYNGGAIYVDNIASSVFDGDFTGNTADCGGAVYGNIEKTTFNGDFIGNTADCGGAIYGNITNSIFNGDFTSNTANTGGAICGNITNSIFNGNFINNAATKSLSTMEDILSSTDNEDINLATTNSNLKMSDVLSSNDEDLLSFMPAMNMVGGAICGNVWSSNFNSNFVANTANVGAVIAGNVEKSVFTGDFSKNSAEYGIIISGNTLKSTFSGNIEDGVKSSGDLFSDWIDSYFKDKYMDKEDKERLENLSKKLKVEIEADLEIYVDATATNNIEDLTVDYDFSFLNFILDKRIKYSASKLKSFMNPLEGPLGDIVGKFIDNIVDDHVNDLIETVTNSTAYLTIKIKTSNNLKDATRIANHFGIMYGDKYITIDQNKKLTLKKISVKVAPGVYRGGNNKGLEINANTDYNLMKDGEGDVIIDAENNGNILTVNSPEINIDGLTFMHASNSAIIFKNGMFKSEINANFIENRAGASSSTNIGTQSYTCGGAIFINGTVENSVFKGNFIDNCAIGSEYTAGGAIFIDSKVSDSIFSGNFIGNSAIVYGGAISTKERFLDCIFSGNFSDNSARGGGAIFAFNIVDSNFSGNFINNSRSAILAYYDVYGSVFSGNFINNSANTGGAICAYYDVYGSIFSGDFINNCADDGGVIKFSNIFDSMFSGNFIYNSAKNGGAIKCGYGTISNSTFCGNFISNSASNRGGAIYAMAMNGDAIANSTFSGNFANNNAPQGGAIDSSQNRVYNSIFNGNFTENTATGYGGVICVDSMDYCNFEGYYNGNTAEYGNVLYTYYFYDIPDWNRYHHNRANIPESDVYDGAYESYKKSLQNALSCCIDDSDEMLSASENRIYVDQSAASNGDGSSYNPFNNLKSAINIANDGDTIYIYPGTYAGENNVGLIINKSLNLIKIGNDDVIFDAQNNGRIFTVDTTSLNIVGLTFTHATDSAITFNADLETSIINADFKNNTNKAALYITGRAVNSIFAGNYIKNTANDGGAAICADSFILCELKANFINNVAANGGAIAGNIISSTINGTFADNNAVNGAAIAGNVMKSVVNAKFTNNTASRNGGAIYGNVSSSNFTGNFTNNNAANGGAIYGSVSSCNFCNDFINNEATNGGAIYGGISSSAFNCNFMNNDAGKGGVVYCSDVSKSVFKGEFTDNGVSADYGKILYSEDVIMDCKFIGEIFVSNLENLTDRVYSNTDNVFNCIFSNPHPIDEKDMNVPALPNSAGKSVTVTLPGDAKGTITLNIGGKSYNFDVIGGVANVKVPDLANGAYPYSITYSGDDKYAPFTKTGSLTINNSPQNTKPTNTKTSTTKKTTKTTLTLKKVKVKKSAKKLVISATLKINGKAAKGKIIKFKFNKKTYNAKTNKKGVAKITIKKAVLKKLKVGKKVTYTATYGKITKKATVKIKK